MEKSLFERMGGTYEMEGDYRLPCLALPAEEKSAGVWGQRHLGTSGGTARPSTRPSGWAAGCMTTLPTLTGRRRKCFFSW